MTPSTQTLANRKPNLIFNLQRMEDIFDQVQGESDVPHRHDYYTVLFVQEGYGTHVVDFKTYEFGSNQVFFVAPGQIHQVNTLERPKGWVITFSRDFLIENSIPETFLQNINLFRSFGDTPPIVIDEQNLGKLDNILAQMEECFPLRDSHRNRALGALLQLFLIYCNHICTLCNAPDQPDEESTGATMLRDFKDLVETRYQDWHKVQEYASELNITPKHLSHTIKLITGKTAKEYIQDRLLLEAKRLLRHTELSMKEISYELGFEEPLHFSGFFKKQEGVSATTFRNQ